MSNYAVCTTTKEIVVYNENGEEVSRKTWTTSKLLSGNIQQKPKKFIDREKYLEFRKEYLQSAEWEAKRQAILKRDSYVCQICGTAKNLQVHHITYDRFGCEIPEDLITLCNRCHEETHAKDLEKKQEEVADTNNDGMTPGMLDDTNKTEANTKAISPIELKEKEDRIIAYLLTFPELISFAIKYASSEDFGYNGVLFYALCSMYVIHESVNVESVYKWLKDHKLANNISRGNIRKKDIERLSKLEVSEEAFLNDFRDIGGIL